jgi:hypothetical protein
VSAAPVLLRPPAWASRLVTRSAPGASDVPAAFAVGAALAALDRLVVAEPPFAGAWRARLALIAAVASGAGDKASLRDARALTPPGGDPGPAGRLYAAWRAWAADGPQNLAVIAADLGGSGLDATVLAATLKTHPHAPAPLAAAAAASAVMTAYPRSHALAYAVADGVLAARLGWRAPLPLLALEPPRVKPGEAAWTAACCAAYARAAIVACDLHAALSAAAGRLSTAAPKLRAKGAGAAISALLADDALSSATNIPGLSDRGLRRLFDRLVELGALRELTGRATFRLYGL